MDTAMEMEKGVNFCQFPHFCKVYRHQSSSERMKLPPGVGKRIPEGPIPTNLFLRNRSGKRFNVRLSCVGNYVFFKGDGWVQFVKNNNLVDNHILVFFFDGTNTFDLKIYEPNGCEKTDEGEEAEDKKEVEVDDDAEEEEEEEEEFEDIKDEDATDAEEDEEEAEEEQKLGNRNRGKKKAKEARFDIYGTEIFKSGAYTQPENPYFVTKWNPNRKHMVYIPKDVVKDLESLEYELPEQLKVRHPRGGLFTLQLNGWADGRIWFKDGWRRLCKSNCVHVDDAIICEFIRRDETEMEVRIARAGTWS